MGGELAVVSKKDEGSTFTLTVSVGRAPGAGQDAPSAAAAMSEVSLRILCAEDNSFGRMALNAMLTELGHRVDFAGTGDAVVSAVQRGGYDVVLMDVMLPGMDGLEATRRIRALPGETGCIPIIGVSARSSDRDQQWARDAGMTDYLTKPISPAALVEALRRLFSVHSRGGNPESG
jgi:CheY-like chemotaxis protein